MKLKVSAALITAFWLISIAALINRHYDPPPEREAARIPTHFNEHWMGIYRGDEKIGYSSTLLDKHDGGYKLSETALMRLNVMGVEKTVMSSIDAFLTGDFRLKSFSYTLNSDVLLNVKGSVENATLSLDIDAGGIKSVRKIRLKETPYISLPFIPGLGKDAKAGTKLSLPIMEPSALFEDSMELEVEGRESVTVSGGVVEAVKIIGRFKGVEVAIWASEEGEIIKQESMGFTFIKERREAAMKLSDGPTSDIIASAAIPFNMTLPADVRYLKVRISGVDVSALELEGENQKLIGDILEVGVTDSAVTDPRNAASLKGQKKTLSKERLEEYLSDAPFIESKDPEIILLAAKITGKEKDTLKKARLIYRWVYENIKKTPALTLPSAREVLQSRRGDCNEHTALFTALARAAGIPARAAVGVVYKDGHFYYHAWPEVFVGGWFALDPALGQWPADATHIRLLTGGLENQIKLASVFGKLKLEGLEFK